MPEPTPKVSRPDETPLESWKEIGAYLQRNAVTARRWEKEEGLPVHRHSHKSRSSVYAYPSEIDTWRVSRKVVPEPPPPIPLWRVPAFALTLVLCLIMVGNGVRPVAAQQGGGRVSKRQCMACPDGYISLDGRWMAFTTSDTSDVAIQDLSTGKETRLTKAAHGEDAVWAMLSADQHQVAYLWDTDDKPSRAQLRVIANAPGSKPRVLVDSPEFEYFDPVSWARDGKSILLVGQKPDRTWQIVRVSAADGSVTMLKNLDWRLPGPRIGIPSSSPDGRYLAYAALATNPQSANVRPVKDERVYILALDGSGETELVTEAGANRDPVWTPDGTHVLFASDRSGTFDLWSVAVRNGKAAGSPALVMADIGDIGSLGMTRSGSYYYSQFHRDVEYVGIAEGNRIKESFVGILPAWSPDGKSVAYKRHHLGNPQAFDLVVRRLETGQERIYTTNLGFTNFSKPRWLQDGNIGVIVGKEAYRVDLNSGEFTPLSEASRPELSRNYIVRRDAEDASHVPDRIFAVDPGTGRETQILVLPEPGFTRVLPSPDGRTLALLRSDSPGLDDRKVHLARVAIDGSGYREIYATDRRNHDSNAAWTQDSRGIVFEHQLEDEWRLMRIPAEGGTPEPVGPEGKGTLQGIEFSPDGSRIAFTSQKSGWEVWVIDNLLSALK